MLPKLCNIGWYFIQNIKIEALIFNDPNLGNDMST